ncbi:MAG TPA: hypothetical protein VK002_12735 [Rubricoccaceae bacterium]|nr:hypothetical protein [Rubricoccaceae bacterium]
MPRSFLKNRRPRTTDHAPSSVVRRPSSCAEPGRPSERTHPH